MREALAAIPKCASDFRLMVTSELTEVECLRTIDRLRLKYHLPESEVAIRRDDLFRLLSAMEMVEISRAVLFLFLEFVI